MRDSSQRRFPGRVRDDGFALAVSLLLLTMLMLAVLGLISLASIEQRKLKRLDQAALAKANARLALMQAIGQLQRTLGPDRRVSANAEILRKSVSHPHWTGVWRSTLNNGDPIFVRDDLAGGLRDQRWTHKPDPAQEVMEWLVSGEGEPTDEPGDDFVSMLTADQSPVVEVPKVAVAGKSGSAAGHYAWWTGDLGVRANLRTGDPRGDLTANRRDPANGGMFRMMASQAAEMAMMSGGVELENEDRARLAAPGMISLAGTRRDWGRKHALDFTVDSAGVLADVANGGLKRDLTAYFEKGAVAPFRNLSGVADDESLVGPVNSGESRHAISGPRFGLLRDWARLAVPFSGKDVPGKSPEFDPAAAGESATRALANEQPVKLAGNQRAALQPVLVEATNFTQMSTYMTQVAPSPMYQLRQLMYPRVVLWNPYNCELKSDRMVIIIQGNGRQEMWTLNQSTYGSFTYIWEGQWLCFEGGRSTGFTTEGIQKSAQYNDPYMGSYYFSIPATTFRPGECLVFSPARAAEYDGVSDYRPGSYNLDSNVLSCEVSPDPSRCYYVSASDIGGGFSFLPQQFWYAKTPSLSTTGDGVENQVDDTRAILKRMEGSGPITFEAFDKLPQVSVLSASLQYGAGRESRLEWGKEERMPIELLDRAAPRPTVIPNVRTREGIRLRWFDEHPSNLINSGNLANTPHFDEALLANWNPRASYVMRSPWENVGGSMPKIGPGGGPWFFGAYTRDLFDQAVSWQDQTPVPRAGRYHGNPFGPPQEGSGRYVLFDVPRNETGIISLGQLQHAKLSELVWHPSYAVGNSLADPRLGTGGFKGLERTAAVTLNPEAARLGGFDESEIGWSSDAQRSAGKDDWAATARAILGGVPRLDNLVYDLSFEVNQKLWDRYFLSSGTPADKRRFAEDPFAHPLPNGRLQLVPSTRTAAADRAELLADFHRAASLLMVDGAFNVNSTRVEAWKALLGSTRSSGFGSGDNVPFPRVLDPQEGPWLNGDGADDREVWAGSRELTGEEVGRLAEAIVAEVKLRGPFLSLADFVNRRLAGDETGRMGALQAAIEKAGLNSTLTNGYPLDNSSSLPDYKHPDNLPDATRMEQTLKPASKAWGAASYLTQADVLQVLGPALAARSDTFVIRAYGDAVDATGAIQSRAWCEAVLQRTPEPLDPDESGLNPRLQGRSGDFGRRFEITSFRWLSPAEI